MGHDPKRGKGNWRGCHYFQNIICDGRFDQVTGPRQGALKLGGRYYYYVSSTSLITSNYAHKIPLSTSVMGTLNSTTLINLPPRPALCFPVKQSIFLMCQ